MRAPTAGTSPTGTSPAGRPVDLALEGPAAPPRANGELVFAEPWESRVFGVTLSLHGSGCFEWSAFQTELIAAVGRCEATPRDSGSGDGDTGAYRYYVCWLEALEALLERLGMMESAQLRHRLAELAARPAGRDHHHDPRPSSPA